MQLKCMFTIIIFKFKGLISSTNCEVYLNLGDVAHHQIPCGGFNGV